MIKAPANATAIMPVTIASRSHESCTLTLVGASLSEGVEEVEMVVVGEGNGVGIGVGAGVLGLFVEIGAEVCTGVGAGSTANDAEIA